MATSLDASPTSEPVPDPLAEAARIAEIRGWTMRPDLDAMRHVVPSPTPRHVLETKPVECPAPRLVAQAHPDALSPHDFPAGSMGPKVAAAAQFAREGSGPSVIGSLRDIDTMFAGRAGTVVETGAHGIEYRA